MNRKEAFQRLGIEITKDERAIKNVYRQKLAVTNPEDNPEGFKLLRAAYEEACKYAREKEELSSVEEPADTTPSGLWLEKVVQAYANIHSRQDVELWKALFEDDIFMSLEEEENCRSKFLRFLMEHFKLPTQIWQLLDKKLNIVSDAKALRERFPAHFVRYIIGKCERGEDVEFTQFEGPEAGEYDLFLQYYDRCWQALQEKKIEEAEHCIKSADSLSIRHPVMEICRANLLMEHGQKKEAVALMQEQRQKYPGDAMICYNAAEILWAAGGDAQKFAAEMYLELKEESDSHYMANVRLTEWYYLQGQYKEAKNCAEKVLIAGGDDDFMELLGKVNAKIEKDLEAKYRESKTWEPALELCWCYLQDGKISKGIRLAQAIEALLPSEKRTEYTGLLAKLYVEQVEYEDAIAMSRRWEQMLRERMADPKRAEKRDKDRLRQAHLIRMQCFHNLGFREKECFLQAIGEAEDVVREGGAKDIGIQLEMAQVYMELEEYEKSLDIINKLVDEYQIFAAYASALEVYRRQLNARGVVQSASQCIRYFPAFTKAYEYLAKVYLDLDYRDELEKVLKEAEESGVKSPILEAYRFQMTHEPMETGILNQKLKNFRAEYHRYVEEGQEGCYEKGLPILTELLYHYPDDFMLVERAIYHRAAHHYREAKEDFEKALYINPANPYALNGLSFVYKYLEDYEKALFYIRKAILYMDDEMSPIIYADMGNLYSLLENYEKALDAYREYERLAGKSKSNWFGDNLAELSMRAGKTEDAAAIYERFYGKDKWIRYEKLVELYLSTGQGEKVWEVMRQWRNEMHFSTAAYTMKAVRNSLSSAAKPKPEIISYPAYYAQKGWAELLFGSKAAAVKAFEKMTKCGFTDNTMEGKLCDAVFACILCGDEKRGKKFAERLKNWLEREKTSGKSRYFNREKKHLQIEFLAAYYTESSEKLREILDRDEKSEICHECINSLCKEMESVKLLFLLRMGKKDEAKERLHRNLESQPWDKHLRAIKHVAF